MCSILIWHKKKNVKSQVTQVEKFILVIWTFSLFSHQIWIYLIPFSWILLRNIYISRFKLLLLHYFFIHQEQSCDKTSIFVNRFGGSFEKWRISIWSQWKTVLWFIRCCSVNDLNVVCPFRKFRLRLKESN